jgi:hypothetical protein
VFARRVRWGANGAGRNSRPGLTWRARAQVEAAVACIQAKIHQACNTWKQDEWWQQAQTHRRKAKLTRSVAYTALPSVVTWWGAKPRGRK